MARPGAAHHCSHQSLQRGYGWVRVVGWGTMIGDGMGCCEGCRVGGWCGWWLVVGRWLLVRYWVYTSESRLWVWPSSVSVKPWLVVTTPPWGAGDSGPEGVGCPMCTLRAVSQCRAPRADTPTSSTAAPCLRRTRRDRGTNHYSVNALEPIRAVSHQGQHATAQVCKG